MNNEIILPNVDFYSAQYCVTAVLGIYCQYYGLDLFADLLGRFWEFELTIQDSLGLFKNTRRKYIIRPLHQSYIQTLEDRFGARFINLDVQDKVGMINQIETIIAEKMPVIVSVNPYNLRHYENYHQYYGLNWNHYIVVYGYSRSSETLYYVDATRAFLKGAKHEISYEEFCDAVFPEKNIYRLSPELIVMEPLMNVQSNGLQIFTKGKETEKNGYEFSGINAIRKLADELRKITTASEEYQNSVLVTILNQVVLISQHRQGNKQFYLKHVNQECELLEKIEKLWDRIKYALSPIRRRKINNRFLMVADYIDQVASMEENFYDLY